MKLHLAQIPEAGLRRALRLESAGMERLAAAIGPQQEPVLAELTIKNRDGYVQIDGMVRTTLHPPCQRCLETVPLVVDEKVHVAMVPDHAYNAMPADFHLGQGDLEVSFYAGEELDLARIVEDELLLLIPEPVADEDEQERCMVCGKSVDELLPRDADGSTEHPFRRLGELLQDK